MLTKTALASCVAASLALGSLPAIAAHAPGHATVWVREAPPALRDEAVPAPRRGYHWAPGYWKWQGRSHVWRRGSWIRARPGYAYANPAWVERDGRWKLRRGRWARRDRDGDGVPNVRDRRPNDPTRR